MEKEIAETKEQGCFLAKALKFAAFMAAAYGVITGVARYMLKFAQKLEAENEGNKKKRYLNFMNGRNLTFEHEEVEEIAVDTCMGGVEVDLTRAELAEKTEVRLRNIMGGIVVKVPPLVNVEVDAKPIMGGVANMVPRYEEEGLKTVLVKVESLMGGVAVKMLPKEAAEA